MKDFLSPAGQVFKERAMEPFYDYKKYYILYVDDEEKSLKYFRETFGDKFPILTAINAEEGLRILKENQDKLGILMTDQRMPGEKGIQFLEKARQINPRVLRILVTAYSDLETAIDAVNTGAIYKYVTKPWDIPQLEVTLKRGIEFFLVQNERDQLLREKMSVLHNTMMTDRLLSLGILASGLSHHIRNSMVAVKTFLDLAPKKLKEENLDLEQLRNPDFWKDYYKKVQSQMDKVAFLLSDLWEASEKPKFDFPNEVKLNEVVEKALKKVEGKLAARKIQIQNHIPADLPALKVDGVQFNRLFELLLEDEANSLPEGSRIQLSAQAVGPAQGPLEIQIGLADNGPGLSSESLQSVFDPFFTRSNNPQDFGLHLMTCFFIVYHHGGKIEASSTDQGTVFTLRIPINPLLKVLPSDDKEFLHRVLLNESLWERLLAEN
jgi:two-component system, probable response regulator PhcQ